MRGQRAHTHAPGTLWPCPCVGGGPADCCHGAPASLPAGACRLKDGRGSASSEPGSSQTSDEGQDDVFSQLEKMMYQQIQQQLNLLRQVALSNRPGKMRRGPDGARAPGAGRQKPLHTAPAPAKPGRPGGEARLPMPATTLLTVRCCWRCTKRARARAAGCEGNAGSSSTPFPALRCQQGLTSGSGAAAKVLLGMHADIRGEGADVRVGSRCLKHAAFALLPAIESVNN